MPRKLYSYRLHHTGSADSATNQRHLPTIPKNETPSTPLFSNTPHHFPQQAPQYTSFTQQGLMERAIAPLNDNDKATFQADTGRFLPLSEWDGVSLNSKGEVIAICWESLFNEEGAIEFRWLPRSLKAFKASDCNLTGHLDLKSLPREMVHLNLSTNNYSGPVALSDLPPTMVAVYLGRNRLEGHVKMSTLPNGLRTLSLGENSIHGPLELRRLPQKMEFLDLSNNRLSDDICIGSLPPEIVIDLVGNDVDRKALEMACGSEVLRDQVILDMSF